MDSWLRRAALRNQDEGTSATHLWVEEDTAVIRGFFTLAPTTVKAKSLSKRQRGGAEDSAAVPALLLAKLALCHTLQGRTPSMGTALLLDALDRALQAADIVGGRLLVVDTRNERASRLYKRHDFTPLQSDPSRMVVRMSIIRQAFAD